jgi:hypothetical protein
MIIPPLRNKEIESLGYPTLHWYCIITEKVIILKKLKGKNANDDTTAGNPCLASLGFPPLAIAK